MLLPGRPDTRKHVAGAATAAGRDSCGEAVERAIANLGQEPGLVLFFPTGHIDADAAAVEAWKAARGACVAGMTGTCAIGGDGLIETGCSAIAFSSTLPAGVGAVEGGDPRAAAREAVVRPSPATDGAPYRVVLLFVDSESGDQAEIVAGAYAVAGGPDPARGGSGGGCPTCAVSRRPAHSRAGSSPSQSAARRRSESESRTGASRAARRRS